jgi:hypothetical protein
MPQRSHSLKLRLDSIALGGLGSPSTSAISCFHISIDSLQKQGAKERSWTDLPGGWIGEETAY